MTPKAMAAKKKSGKKNDDGSAQTDVVADAHDSLVKSLESIKELLLKSESKISAAKESIARADMGKYDRKESAAPSTTNDSLPLFDLNDDASADADPPIPEASASEQDIDAFLSELDDSNSTHSDDDVPMLEDVVVPGKSGEEALPGESDITPSLSADAIEDIMNEFQKKLEKKIHDTLIQAIVQLESELKAQIREEIEELRQQLQDPSS